MKAAVYKGIRDVGIREKDMPTIQHPDDVIIRVQRTSICGSDLYIYRGDLHETMAPGESGLGHEMVGTVVEVGPSVTRYRVGDRITAAYSVSCGSCPSCRLGMTAHCETTNKAVYGFGRAFGNLEGAQAEYLRIPHAEAHTERVPETISDDQAIFLSCNLPAAITGVENAQIQLGDYVGVVGLGTTGQLALRLAANRGAARLFALDRVPARLAKAAQVGAQTIPVSDPNCVEQVWELTAGHGLDVVIEAAGQRDAFDLALQLLRPGGTYSGLGVYVGGGHPLNIGDVFLRDLRIFTYGFDNTRGHMWPAIRLIERGVIDPATLITHRFTLDQIADAYRLFDQAEDGVIKVAVHPPGGNHR
ncbi:alcohol dehydrogenase catalytic domain-containing protein [Kyrpidia spormannii]|uniref:Alcohol dehydrogenase n=1 Tax=Kyrpidia spormannii TaxID=2055160 RepID=A0A6F9ECC3_9BACL|nr:alcohol dehydrogenase catalytic domain-containing protein [Kyrpidia spormannii]CAB3394521.1 Alcohol dehydrogenase [Kyrpidia spormannii]